MTTAGKYSIGSDDWNGLSKLIEECGELQQVAGKIIGADGASEHFDGTNLQVAFEEELADIAAAIEFVCAGMDRDAMQRFLARRARKLKQFHEWNQQARGGR